MELRFKCKYQQKKIRSISTLCQVLIKIIERNKMNIIRSISHNAFNQVQQNILKSARFTNYGHETRSARNMFDWIIGLNDRLTKTIAVDRNIRPVIQQ